MGSRRRGFALIIVLIATAGVFAIAMQAAVMSRAATIESRVTSEHAQALRQAKAAAAVVLRALVNPAVAGPAGVNGGAATTSRSGPASNQPKIELPAIVRELLGDKADEIENGARDLTDPSTTPLGRLAQGGGVTGRAGGQFTTDQLANLPRLPVEVSLPGDAHVYRVLLKDAAGQLNINKATAEQLHAYFVIRGLTPTGATTLTDQILDWIDEDSFIRPRGAEQEQYVSRGITCANRPIRSLRELLYLPAMTRELFDRIEDDLSLAGDSRIHIPTASREILMTVPGISPEIADRLVSLAVSGTLDEAALEDALPIGFKDSKDMLRLDPGPIVRVVVEIPPSDGGPRMTFAGLAVVRNGGVHAVGLRQRALLGVSSPEDSAASDDASL